MTRDGVRGRLFIFEGPDGVGKTTLAKALVEDLTRRGVHLWIVSEHSTRATFTPAVDMG